MIHSFQQAEKTNQAIISHWHPNITINFVTDQTSWIQGTIPSPLNECKSFYIFNLPFFFFFIQFLFIYFIVSVIEFTPNGNYYKPVVFYNDFWNLLRDYQPINDTTQYVFF